MSNRINVLLVDDEKEFCELMARQWVRSCHVTWRTTIDMGLAEAERIAEVGDKIDIVLLDLMFPCVPVELVYASIERFTDSTNAPVHMLTGHNAMNRIDEAIRHGAAGMWPKEFMCRGDAMPMLAVIANSYLRRNT